MSRLLWFVVLILVSFAAYAGFTGSYEQFVLPPRPVIVPLFSRAPWADWPMSVIFFGFAAALTAFLGRKMERKAQ